MESTQGNVKVEVNKAPNSRQVGGSHYSRSSGLQHWDVVNLLGLDYFQGNITKYVFRFREKGGIQDLEKAKHYLDKLIEIEKTKNMTTIVGVFSVPKQEDLVVPKLEDPLDNHGKPFDFKPVQVTKDMDDTPDPLIDTPILFSKKTEAEKRGLELKDYLPKGMEEFRLMRRGEMYNRIDKEIKRKYPKRKIASAMPSKNGGMFSDQWEVYGAVYFYRYNSKIMAIMVPHLEWYFISLKNGFGRARINEINNHIVSNTRTTNDEPQGIPTLRDEDIGGPGENPTKKN